jgi:hypothetical protein
VVGVVHSRDHAKRYSNRACHTIAENRDRLECLLWVLTDKTQSEHNESALLLKADVRAGSVDFAFGPMSIHLSFRMRRHLLSARLDAPLRPFTPVQLDRRRVFALFLGCQRVAWAFAVDPFGGTTLSIPPLEGFLGWIVLTLAMLVGHDRNMRPIPRGRHPALFKLTHCQRVTPNAG